MPAPGAQARRVEGVRWADALFVGAIVLAAALFGIMTRPVGMLAAIWPANALLLGLMVRKPELSSPLCWLSAIAGYVAADLVTGGALIVAIWLTAGNMAGVATAWWLFRRRPHDDHSLSNAQSVLSLFAICAAASLAAAVVGGSSVTWLFDRSLLAGFGLWFTTELANYVVILPALLTAPGWKKILGTLRNPRAALPAMTPASLGPITALILGLLAAHIIGGPGALAFPLPALLWCALNYNFFATCLLTLLTCTWQMVAISLGLMNVPYSADAWHSLMSIRLGITLLALGPITVAGINRARNDLLHRLNRAANYDALTETLSRRTLMKHGERMHADMPPEGGMTVLMLDIDNFKSINDRYGHPFGDRVLIEVCRAIRGHLRQPDLFGRLGGDEFAIMLAQAAPAEGPAIAERLRDSVEKLSLIADDGHQPGISVSIGIASCTGTAQRSLEDLLDAADRALYRAKLMGRNRVSDSNH